MRTTTKGIAAEIAKGAFRPHTALTNMALSYYQNSANYLQIPVSDLPGGSVV